MKCSNIKTKLLPYLEASLSASEMREVEAHLQSCESCQTELEEMKQMLSIFNEVSEEEPSKNIKAGFLDLLEEEKQMQRISEKQLPKKEFPWKHAFQIAASVVLVLCGYLFGTYMESENSQGEIAVLKQETTQLKQDMLLAMMDNKSVSKRIQAVSYTSETSQPDEKIIEAIIDRLHFDGNVNVRLAAVEALAVYGTNEKVKTAFIKSLTNEKNPTIQIAVIQFLVEVQETRARAPMQELLEQTETPNYVKAQVNQGLQQLI